MIIGIILLVTGLALLIASMAAMSISIDMCSLLGTDDNLLLLMVIGMGIACSGIALLLYSTINKLGG